MDSSVVIASKAYASSSASISARREPLSGYLPLASPDELSLVLSLALRRSARHL
jgi:hypothetical protein